MPRGSTGAGPRARADQPRPRRVAVLAGLRGARPWRAGAVARPALRGATRGGRRSATGTSPSAYEAMARASAVAGDPAAAADWKAKAIAALDGIADHDDREVIENDIATLPDLRYLRRPRAPWLLRGAGGGASACRPSAPGQRPCCCYGGRRGGIWARTYRRLADLAGCETRTTRRGAGPVCAVEPHGSRSRGHAAVLAGIAGRASDWTTRASTRRAADRETATAVASDPLTQRLRCRRSSAVRASPESSRGVESVTCRRRRHLGTVRDARPAGGAARP